MYSETKDSFFDGLLIAVFNDFFDKIDDSPSDEELATLYPVPAHGAKRYIKAEKKSRKKKATPLIILRRAAVIFLAIVSVAFAVLMTNDGIRAAVFETVAKWHKEFVEFEFSRSSLPAAEEKESVYDFEIGYIPDGFELNRKNEKESFRSYEYYVNGDEEERLSIRISLTKNTKVAVDSERSEIEHTMINGMDTYIAYWKDYHQGSVTMGNKEYIISISGRLDCDELVKIAENIK